MRRLALAAVSVAVLCSVACGRPRTSILLISVDSLRADEVGAVVDGKPVAPRMAEFAREAVSFDGAVAAASWTTPSMMSVMTGLPARAHGVEEHDRALAPQVETLAERLQRSGYKTAAFVPAVTLRPEYGFGRGFGLYDFEDFGHHRTSSPALTGKVLNQLEQWKAEPFFIWVHLWDPHYNYLPPPPWDSSFRGGTRPAREDLQCLKWVENAVTPMEAEYLRGQFRGEIAYTDRHVGEILDQLNKLGLSSSTIVVVLGDHGEAFNEHGWLTHTMRVDQEMVRVPLMFRWPAKLVPRHMVQPVSLASVARTVLRLALDQRDFGSTIALDMQAEAPTAAAPVLTETVRMGCFTALVDASFKYVLDHRSCRETLFDLSADPGERDDLSANRPDVLLRYRAELQRQLAGIKALHTPHAALPPETVNEAEAALRSIGYVAGGGKPSGSEIVCAMLPDPRTIRHDAFGDALVYEACPSEGPERCFATSQPGR